MDFPQYAGQAVYAGATRAAIAGYGAYKAYKMSKPTAYKNKRAIARLSKQVALNKGELKCKQFNATTPTITAGNETSVHLTDIGTGTTVDTREGRYIHIYGIEVRIQTGNPVMVNNLVLSRAGVDTTDIYGVTKARVAFIDNTHKDDFKELHLFRNYGADANAANYNGSHSSYRRKFKRPIQVVYDSSAASGVIRNALFLSFKNAGTVDHAVSYAVRLWYRDH